MSLKNPNPLTTMAAQQLHHDHHVLLYIGTLLTSLTLNMSKETFKLGHDYLRKLTMEINPIWKQMINRVLIAKNASNIVLGI
jgi:hypothetical protein